jgi:ligand-binding sensor domain-containing protein
MIRTNCLVLLSMLLAYYSAFSQEYSYTHYDISDGLAGSTVYCITQDKDGFIWTGTETGVSRFDGTHFHNYTTVDGLPDVEVLEMFCDSKGRVWMAPFRKSICYYYKGRFYNQDNDSTLRKLRIGSNVEQFAEDKAGNILVATRYALYLLNTDGSVHEFDSIRRQPIRNCATVSSGPDGKFLVQEGSEIYKFFEGAFTPFFPIVIESSSPIYLSMNPLGLIWRKDSDNAVIHSFATGRTVPMPFERAAYRHISFSTLDDSLFYYNENSGALEYNLHTGVSRQLLPGRQVSRTFRDVSGSLWFTTLGQGIYRLNSDEFRTIKLTTPDNEQSSVYAIRRLGDNIVAGDNHNYLFVLRLADLTLKRIVTLTAPSKNRVADIDRMSNGNVYIASDLGIEEMTADLRRIFYNPIGLKSCVRIDSNRLLFASFWGAGIFDLRTFKIADTLWRERASTVFYHRDTAYIGTLNGLYAKAGDRSVVALGDKIPFFRKRISAMAEAADGTMWIGSYDAGVVGYRDGNIVARFSKRDGLTSDICRTLCVNGSTLWIGTDKGLTRIILDRPGYPMNQYTSQDGLGSDMINSIYVDGTVTYVGTPSGLSFFDERKIDVSEGCRIHLLSINNSDRERIGDTANLVLPYADKHVRIEFAGISYRSVGDITYRYRLLGLDSVWRTTRENFLEYPTLPSGSYDLQLQAVNKFGLKSIIMPLHFVVATPWWQTFWFYGVVLAALLSLIWLFVTLRIRQIRNRQREKEKLGQRIMEMEHMALQAQMNPHFIFNCLNSIQQYIFEQDIFAANKYLTGFSKLIRATLQNSSKSFILLSEEISYLSGYLSLEKLRFKEKMDYSVEVDPALQGSDYMIPPMLIQPYVENSMRHGLRHKITGNGFIHIHFQHTGTRLSVVVEDNGIGRKGAAAFKTREHIEYQSKGMSLTADRIRMMNARYGDAIKVEVIDLEDDEGRPAGTRVIMNFPLFHYNSEYETI